MTVEPAFLKAETPAACRGLFAHRARIYRFAGVCSGGAFLPSHGVNRIRVLGPPESALDMSSVQREATGESVSVLDCERGSLGSTLNHAPFLRSKNFLKRNAFYRCSHANKIFS